jgi:hypothetical protein
MALCALSASRSAATVSDRAAGHYRLHLVPETHAAITTGVTNAGSEGTNRVIKTDARCAYGYRNPANHRLRARAATTRRARGHLTTRTSGRHSQPRKNSST